MAGRVYTISFENVTVSVAQDFFSVKAADDKPLKLHAVKLVQFSDVGDAQEEMLRLQIVRGNTTIGSGGTNPTMRPVLSSSPAAGPTTNVRVNDTTKVSGGTGVVLDTDGMNIRIPYLWLPTPEMQIQTTETDGFLAVQLVAAPADALTMSGTMYLEELA